MNHKYQNFMHKVMCFFIIFSCFSISMPTAWISISTGLLFITWLISGDYIKKYESIRSNPSAVAVLGLFAIYVIAFFYTSAPLDQSGKFLLKYSKLLFIPIVISIVDSKKIREYGINAFLFGSFILVFISYFKWLDILPMDLGLADLPNNDQGYNAFKNRIAHNILVSFAMYLAICKFYFDKSRYRFVWFFLAFLMLFNIMYLVYGRSGQVVALFFLFFLPLYFFRMKALQFFIVFFIFGFLFKSQLLMIAPDRLIHTNQELAQHKPNESQTSAGVRMEMYQNDIILIKKSPIFGYGTGAHRNEYNKLASKQSTLQKDVPNPHNQFLLTTVEIGFMGLLTLLSMFYRHWQCSNLISIKDAPMGLYLKGLIITILIGSLFNSLILDATEGKFYCILAGLILSAYKKND